MNAEQFLNEALGGKEMVLEQWRVLEIGETIESGDERYWPKNMAWTTVTESCVGSQVVRTDHVVRRKISNVSKANKC